jgi:Rod binding domain-containing protein
MVALVAPTATVNPGASPSPKLVKAARQFEALLLESLLGPMERTFSALPGGANQAGSDTYNSLGVQALSAGLAASGGLGIASMIVRNLMKNHGIAVDSRVAAEPKVSLTSSR